MIFNSICLAVVLIATPTDAIFAPSNNTKVLNSIDMNEKLNEITSRKLQSSLQYLIVGNYNQDNQVLINDGSGSFTPSILPGGAQNTYSVAPADVNGDGHMDIIVGNVNQDNQVLLNDGSGSFTASVLPGGALITTSISTADVNNDGYVDIIVGNGNQDNQVLINDGSGSFTASTLPGGALPTEIVAPADVNGDGHMDIIVGNYNQDNQVLINDGSGSFAASVLPGGALITYSVPTADVNNDGHVDIIVGNYNQDNQVLINDGSGSFTASTLPGGALITRSISTADVNEDGHVDIIVGNHNQDNQVLINDGSGSFTASTLPRASGSTATTFSISAADVNEDGIVDLIVGNNNGDNEVLVNDGTGSFTASILPGGALNTRSLFVVVSDLAETESPLAQAGPWDITFDASTGLTTDFSATSNNELTFSYSIGKDRPYIAPTLFKQDCTSPIIDLTITQATPVRTPDDASYDTLTLEYDIDKSSIGGSAIYDASTGKLKVCQVLQLTDSGMIIYEDKHLATITFDLDVDFTIEDQDLGAEADATVVTGAAGVDSYVEAYKCGAGDMTENTSALDPNTDLYVCVRSTSADVEIDSLDEMDITGAESNGQQSSLEVIDLGQPKYTAFTSVETISATERRVKTRVPASNFDYNGNGQAISIIGSVTMKLTGSGRKLRVDVGTNLFEGSGSTDQFEFVVGLQPEKDEEDAFAKTKMNEMNSSPNTKSVELSIAIAILAFANAIW